MGRLFPQPSPEAYAALVPGSIGCKGERVERLWLELSGPDSDRSPLVAFPSHPAFSHEILHDLLDPFHDYFRVGYLELPGTRRNPAPAGPVDPLAAVEESFGALKQALGAARVHLLGHLASCPLVLEIACRHPESVASVILVDPDLSFRERLQALATAGELRELAGGELAGLRRRELALFLIERLWSEPPEHGPVQDPEHGEKTSQARRPGHEALPAFHRQGLAGILGAGMSPQQLRRELGSRRGEIPYRRLAALEAPMLVFCGRDCPATLREDALHLRSSVASAELAPLEQGGAWSAWMGSRFFANKLLAHKNSSEQAKSRQSSRPRARRTLGGLPLGWMILLFAALTWGLTLGMDRLSLQPPYMSRVLPALLGGLLPLLWCLAPRRLRLLKFLRFRAFTPRNILPSLAAGALLGVFYHSLLSSQGGFRLPAGIPPFLVSLAPGAAGRAAHLAAMGVTVLFVIGVVENLLILRRAPGRLVVPALLFVLVPLSYPGLLWQVPAALGAALLFARSLSIAGPLALLAGLAAASEAEKLCALLPFPLEGTAGIAVAAAALAGAVLLVVLPGRKRRGWTGQDLYYAVGLSEEQERFRWRVATGVVLVVFTLIAAAATVLGFIA
ncbi:MAG: hypothetical protein JW820_20055, partial [Spirochaetales bacterium]|nr:hypothetical protein [Spirochaetales bacterium]